MSFGTESCLHEKGRGLKPSTISRLRQIVPTPSKWPQHELSSAKLRIKELEKDLESSRKALDVADDYSEKLSARVAELERRLRIG